VRRAATHSPRIHQFIRETSLVTTDIRLVPLGTLPRSDCNSKLVDRSDAQ
jgi:hypothetical protein